MTTVQKSSILISFVVFALALAFEIAIAMASSDPYRIEDEAGPAGEDEDTGEQVVPIVKLEEVAFTTGEEEEDVIFDLKAKLYRYDREGKQWKERGVGSVRLLKHKDSGKVRLVMRQAKTLKICANHLVLPTISVQEHVGNDKSCVWHATDFADGKLKDELFCLRFASVESFTGVVGPTPNLLQLIASGGLRKEVQTPHEEEKDQEEKRLTTQEPLQKKSASAIVGQPLKPSRTTFKQCLTKSVSRRLTRQSVHRRSIVSNITIDIEDDESDNSSTPLKKRRISSSFEETSSDEKVSETPWAEETHISFESHQPTLKKMTPVISSVSFDCNTSAAEMGHLSKPGSPLTAKNYPPISLASQEQGIIPFQNPSSFMPSAIKISAIDPSCSLERKSPRLGIERDTQALKIPVVAEEEEVIQKEIRSPEITLDKDVVDFFASLGNIVDQPVLSATSSTSPANLPWVKDSKLAEIKEKLDNLLSLEFTDVIHPDRQAEVLAVIDLLQSCGGLDNKFITFATMFTKIVGLASEYESAIYTSSEAEDFIAEIESLRKKISSFQAEYNVSYSAFQPLQDKIALAKDSVKAIDAQIAELIVRREKIMDEIAQDKKKAKEISHQVKELGEKAKEAIKCHQLMKAELPNWERLKAESTEKKADILGLWDSLKESCSEIF